MCPHGGKEGWGPGRGSPEQWQSAALLLAVWVCGALELQLVNQRGKNRADCRGGGQHSRSAR